MGRFVGEVGILVGVGFHIEELDAAFCVFAVLNVRPFFIAQQEAFARGGHAEGGGAGFVFGVLQHRRNIFALQAGLRGEAAEAGESGIKIEQLDEGFADGGFLAGHADDERHLGGLIAQAHFGPEIVLAEMVAVVAGEDDDGAIGRASCRERV